MKHLFCRALWCAARLFWEMQLATLMHSLDSCLILCRCLETISGNELQPPPAFFFSYSEACFLTEAHAPTLTLSVCSANKWPLLLFVVQQLNTKEGLDILVVVPQLKRARERRVELSRLVLWLRCFLRKLCSSFPDKQGFDINIQLDMSLLTINMYGWKFKAGWLCTLLFSRIHFQERQIIQGQVPFTLCYLFNHCTFTATLKTNRSSPIVSSFAR